MMTKIYFCLIYTICIQLIFLFAGLYSAQILENEVKRIDNLSKVNKKDIMPPGMGTVSTDQKDIHFYVYSDPSKPNDFKEILLGDVPTLESSGLVPGKIILLCLPFSGATVHMERLKNAYLNQSTPNVIIMNYSNLFKPQLPVPLGFVSYLASMKNVPLIGEKGAEFINFLHDNNKLDDARDLHIIGWSLGAHSASSIGYNLQKTFKLKPGRITGLDVAGPFNQYLKEHKFNKNSAHFVDSIHSDIFMFGTIETMGHTNFFINGGSGRGVNQADCEGTDKASVVGCAHALAVELYALTVTKEVNFTGCSCNPSYPIICLKNSKSCMNPTTLGEYCPPESRGNFYVDVNRKVVFNVSAVVTDPN